MELLKCEVKPGVVIDANDPDKLGRIKTCSPAEFTPNMDTELLPWCYPMDMRHYQSFSKMIKGAKVWIIKNNDNHNEYFYIPMFEEVNITKDFLNEHYEDDPEILIARDNGGTKVMISYNSSTGIELKLKDLYIQIHPNSDILIHSDKVDMDIKDGKVYLGAPSEPYEPAVFGQKLTDILSNLKMGFDTLVPASGNPWDCALTAGFTQCQAALAPVETIKCHNTFVN